MPEISTAKTPAQRALVSVVKKDRLLNAILAGSKTMFFSLARTLYAFWLQTTGLIYLMFTALAGWSLFKQYRDHFVNRKALLLVAPLFVTCFWFTLVSFRRAKRTLRR
jgi:hypothetical protein